MTSRPRPVRVEYGGTQPIDRTRPRFSWIIDDDRRGAAQSAYHLQLSGTRPDSVIWESGTVESNQSLFVPYDGPELEPCSIYHARVRTRDHLGEWAEWSEPTKFETAIFDAGEWRAAWIAPEAPSTTDDSSPPPLMRRAFTIDGAVGSARLFASARGLMEIEVNGVRVGDHLLSPGWTDFDRRAQYVVFDVTDLLSTGENVIGAHLGDGWFSGRIARVRDGERRFSARPQFFCELHVSSTDDERSFVLGSDEEWRWRTGPITASDIYDGESYDARLELPGWSSPGFDAGPEWQPVVRVGAATEGWSGTGSTILDAKVTPPVRAVRTIAARSVTEPAAGRYVYDLGQNISGWARVRLVGTRDQKITLRFAEMLQEDGSLYVENLRSAKATDHYICARDGEFEWEPRFTFHGFRYVEVTGVETAPEMERIVGVVVHNDMDQTGSFSCSHELVSQLQSNIEWGQRGNYLEAPTDCPQRDERLGWTGDAQVFIPTGAFLFDVSAFFAKWQRDLVDAQNADGTIPEIAPVMRYIKPSDERDGGPAWSDAFVICPWTVYSRYGDRRILEEHYKPMLRFIDSMRASSRGLIRADEFVVENGGYGDWVSMDAPGGSTVGATPKDLIGTAYFAHCTDLMRRVASILGHDGDERALRDLYRRIVDAFRSEFVTPSGRVLGETQTAYVVALAFDLLPHEHRQPAADRLIRMLERREWRLTTGFVGTPLLCPVLTRFGRSDVAQRLLLQEEFPSWLYTVNQGATTMWERWNSYTHEHGFGPVSMNSFNHYAYGSIGDWIYSSVAGLRVDLSEPGIPPIRIEPHPGGGLEHAEASLATPFGTASSSWRLSDGRVTLDVAIPPNATARVVLPVGASQLKIYADDEAVEVDAFVTRETSESESVTLIVEAGRFHFSWSAER